MNSIGFKVNEDDIRAVNQAYQDIQNNAEEAAKKIQDTLGEATQRLADNLDAVAQRMLENDAIQTALDRANQRMQEFDDLLHGTAERTGDLIQDGADNAGDVIEGIAERGGDLMDEADRVSDYIRQRGIDTGNSLSQTANQTVSKITSLAKRLFAIFGIGLSLRSLNAIAEEFDGIGDRITYAAENAANVDEIMQNILESANRARLSYGQFANQVTALKQANKNLFPLEEAAKMVEYTTKLGKAAGYSDGEISSMNSIIKRIVANGKAGQMDITRLIRQTPAFAEMLAKALDTDTNKLGEMAKAGKITAETLKKAVMDSTASIDESFANLNFGVSEAMTQIRNQFGVWVDKLNKQYNITQNIAKTMVKGYEAVMKVVNKVVGAFDKLAKMVGGSERLFKMLIATAAGLWVVLNINKVKTFVDGFKSLFNPASLKILAVTAALVALYLIIEDIAYFMTGKRSLLGKMLEEAGINSDEVREKLFGIGDSINSIIDDGKKIASDVITPIADALKDVGTALGDIIGVHSMEEFLALCGKGFVALAEYVADFVSGIANAVTGVSDFVNMLGLLIQLLSALSRSKITDWGDVFSEFNKANGEYMGALAEDFGAQYHATFVKQNPFSTDEEIAAADAAAKEARENRDKAAARTKGARTMYSAKQGAAVQSSWEDTQQFYNETMPKLTLGQKAGYFAATSIPFINNIVGKGEIENYFRNVAEKNDKASQGIENTTKSASEAIISAIQSGMANRFVEISSGALNEYRDMKALFGSRGASARTVNNTTRNNTNKTVNVTLNQSNTFNGDRGVQQNTEAAMGKATRRMTDDVTRAMKYAG